MTASCWSALPAARDRLLEAVDLHGAHDQQTTTPEMAMRVIDAIDQRLTVVLRLAEQALEHYPNSGGICQNWSG